MRRAYPAGVYKPLAKFSKKTETNIAPIVTRTIARPFAAAECWDTGLISLRGGVVIVVMVNLVQWMLYQIANIHRLKCWLEGPKVEWLRRVLRGLQLRFSNRGVDTR